MGIIKFECTSLKARGKAGVLQKREDGSYVQPVGGLNVFNSAGQFYVYEEARALFERSSQFMRRVEKGNLKAEVGHPKPLPGQSEEGYLRRIMAIEETNVCALHREIWLDFDNVKDDDGKPVIAIMSAVYPSGPHGQMLVSAYANPGENVNFSIRAFTDDYQQRGIIKRALKQIITFDFVTEPGISYASKFRAPALESHSECQFSSDTLRRALTVESGGVGLESSVVVAGHELMNAMGWRMDDGGEVKPAYLNW